MNALTSGVQSDQKFDVRPGIAGLDRLLSNEGIAPSGTLTQFVDQASGGLIGMVEGFSTAIRDALRNNSAMKTNDPNSHELEESVVDAFLAAIQGAEGVWDWEGMVPRMKAAIVAELLREKQEDDFSGSVFVEADRSELLPFLERVRIGNQNIFDALQAWYETSTQLPPADVGHRHALVYASQAMSSADPARRAGGSSGQGNT